jgi:hypothetical protein
MHAHTCHPARPQPVVELLPPGGFPPLTALVAHTHDHPGDEDVWVDFDAPPTEAELALLVDG